MRIVLLSPALLAFAPQVASAQQVPGMSMPGMAGHHHHPAPAEPVKPRPPGKPKATPKPPTPRSVDRAEQASPPAASTQGADQQTAAVPALGAVAAPTPEEAPAANAADQDRAGHGGHEGHDMSGMADMAGMDPGGHGGHAGHMTKSALGPYGAARDASGTSWQPDTSSHGGIHVMRGGWALMLHGTANLVYSNQSGPRGDQKVFVQGHFMGAAARDLSPRDRVQFRVALTPDPLMGPRGYPLLLATGETADGRTQLIDRQHPHDLVSELSVSVSHRFSDRVGAYLFYGEVGDPAFGPPAYLHRLSIQDDPEAPVSHHWLDSMHGTQGVITAGLSIGAVKAEISGFRGREPDQHRYDLEAPRFDSIAARLSWNPARTLALQFSYAYQVSPEQVTPRQDQERYSASAIYTRAIGERGFWSTTFAWGRRIDREPGEASVPLDAYVLESAIHPDYRWTVFGRAERVENDELLPAPGDFHGPAFVVGKLSAGAIRDFRVAEHIKIGIGALASRTFVPRGLDVAYGGDRWSGQVFARFRID